METITLNSGATMPRLGFGVYKVADEETRRVVGTALEAGYRSIDTAAFYGNERGVGLALADSGLPRDEVFVTTKVWPTELRPARLRASFEKSLELLGLDRVNLFLIHWPAPATDAYLAAWSAMEELADSGLSTSIGVSNFEPEHLDRVVALGGRVPAVNQIEVHPLLRNADVQAADDAHGIATEAWSPLGRGQAMSDPVLREIAERHGATPAQVIIRWHLQQDRIVIPKSQTAERIRENFAVDGFSLTPEELSRIDGLDRGQRTGSSPLEVNPELS